MTAHDPVVRKWIRAGTTADLRLVHGLCPCVRSALGPRIKLALLSATILTAVR